MPLRLRGPRFRVQHASLVTYTLIVPVRVQIDENGERTEPTIAVTLRREAGKWQAEILLNHLGQLVTEVTLNAIAFGSSE
jgi:hypothetical protein